jgi:alpha-L-rhamnosidase
LRRYQGKVRSTRKPAIQSNTKTISFRLKIFQIISQTGCLAIMTGLLLTVVKAEELTVTPSDLRCEYRGGPVGIDVRTPRLSWKLAVNPPAARGVKQHAYQILVASSPELLAGDKGDVWDSGKVSSDDSVNIAFAGKPLGSREELFWKVRVWVGGRKPSAWSEPARWEMGFLNPEDWQAKWIDAPTAVPGESHGTVAIVQADYGSGQGSNDVTGIVAARLKDNTLFLTVSNEVFGGDPAPKQIKRLRVVYTIDGERHETDALEGTTLKIPEDIPGLDYLRKEFVLGKPVAKARLYATALGLYELHLNGQRVGDHLFAPDWTDYKKRVQYQTYDVTELVKSGTNALAGFVGNGWYAGHIGNGGFQAWGKVPALFAQLEVVYQDGTVERVVTDASWKIHPGPIITSDLMLGENYDARREISGWDQPGLDVSNWSNATERAESSSSMDVQVAQPVRETGEMAVKSAKEIEPGRWVFDFGQNMVGFLRIKVSAPAGTKIGLRHAEMLNPDGSIYTNNLRGATAVDTYICKGDGVEIWQPRFTFHGFRYAEITGLPQPPACDTVTGIVVGTDIPRSGEFACSNPDVNQLQSNIQWGMRGNYFSVPTDCPQRDERMGWMGDAEVFIRTAAYNGDIAAFFTKWLVDVDDAQSADGQFMDVSPSPSGRGHGNGGVPAWGDAGVICPWTIYLVYDDKRILERHLPAMKRWVDWCEAHSTNYIRVRNRGNDYGDWLAQGEITSKELLGSAYFAHSASLTADACKAVGDATGAKKYQRLFENIKTAFNQHYVSADGHIQGGTQTSYALALKFDLLPESLRSQAAQYLAENVASHGDHLTTGFLGVSCLLPALCSQGRLDAAYRVFLQDTFPSWLFSVKQGATTIWERWDGWTPEKGFQDPHMNSFNHYSLGSCGEWMFNTVAGIGLDPDQPGFKHILIRPQPGGGLTHAEASYDSVRGKIVAQWMVKEGNFSFHVTIPPNTTAAVELPTKDSSSVRESGKKPSQQAGIKSLKASNGNARFLVGSGSYDFTCPVQE